MQLDHFTHIQLGQFIQWSLLINGKEMSTLCQLVHYYPDRVMPFCRPRQMSYKIHGNTIPFPLRDIQWLKCTPWPLMFNLGLLTYQARCYEVGNVDFHSIPPERLFQILIHLSHTWVYAKTTFMPLFHDLFPQSQISRHTDPISEP